MERRRRPYPCPNRSLIKSSRRPGPNAYAESATADVLTPPLEELDEPVVTAGAGAELAAPLELVLIETPLHAATAAVTTMTPTNRPCRSTAALKHILPRLLSPCLNAPARLMIGNRESRRLEFPLCGGFALSLRVK